MEPLDAVAAELAAREYRLALVVGGGASGKTTCLRRIAAVVDPDALSWDPTKAVVSEVAPGAQPAEAIERLLGAGLSTIPTWTQPYRTLSDGQKVRAVLARCLADGAGLDDFGAELHSRAANTAAACVRQLVDRRGLRRVAFATSKPDVARWLQPCVVVVLGEGAPPRLVWNPRAPGESRRPLHEVRCRRWSAEQLRAGPLAFKNLGGVGRPLTARAIAKAGAAQCWNQPLV